MTTLTIKPRLITECNIPDSAVFASRAHRDQSLYHALNECADLLADAFLRTENRPDIFAFDMDCSDEDGPLETCQLIVDYTAKRTNETKHEGMPVFDRTEHIPYTCHILYGDERELRTHLLLALNEDLKDQGVVEAERLVLLSTHAVMSLSDGRQDLRDGRVMPSDFALTLSKRFCSEIEAVKAYRRRLAACNSSKEDECGCIRVLKEALLHIRTRNKA